LPRIALETHRLEPDVSAGSGRARRSGPGRCCLETARAITMAIRPALVRVLQDEITGDGVDRDHEQLLTGLTIALGEMVAYTPRQAREI
jgi:hypothetical protein